MGKQVATEVRPMWLFLGSLITNIGICFIWPLTTIYMHNYLGEPLTLVGIVLFLNSGIQIVGNYLGGYLFDRWKPFWTIIIGLLINMSATALLIFFHSWPAFPILLVISGFGIGMVATCINSYATQIQSRKPSYIFNVLYFLNNLALVVGTLMVGFLLPFGIGLLFSLALIMYAIFLVIILLTYNVSQPELAHNTGDSALDAEQPMKMPVENLQRIFSLMFVFVIVWLFYEQWQSNISAYMVVEHLTVQDYSTMWTINAIIIVLLQPVMTYFDDWLLKHLNARLVVGFILIGASFLILPIATSYVAFMSSMALLTVGEVFALPAVATFVNMYSIPSQKGRYQGLVNVFASAGRAVGPLAGALVIEAASYSLLFYMAVVAIWLGTGVFWIVNRRAASHAESRVFKSK